MHDQSAQGNEFFKCDFCRRGWSEDRPMVEGHQGSLICAPCLTIACVERAPAEAPFKCVMCLQEGLTGACWASPLHAQSLICGKCIAQSAGTLERDPEYGWKRPR